MRWPLCFDGAAGRSIPKIDPVELLSQPSASLMAATPQAKTQAKIPDAHRRLPKYMNKDNKKYPSKSLFENVKLPSQPLASLLVRTPQVKTLGPYRRLPEYIEKDDKRNLRISLFGWEFMCVYFIVFILIICVIRF